MKKIDLISQQKRYQIELAEGENIKILVNENQVFEQTVASGYKATATFNYLEEKL